MPTAWLTPAQQRCRVQSVVLLLQANGLPHNSNALVIAAGWRLDTGVMTQDPPQPPAIQTAAPAHRRRSLLLVILAVGLVLIAVAGLYLHFSFALPVGTGPAGPKVERASFAQPWTSRPVLLVGLGDSVTAGFGARHGYGYFDRLTSNPAEEFADMKGISLASVMPHLTVTNLSVSGSVSHELVAGQMPQIPPASPQTLGWIVITTGGNDLIHNYGRTPPRDQAMYGATWEQAKPWIEGFEHRLEAIASGLSARFAGGCQIFLANIYDPSDGVGDIQRAGLPAWPDGPKVLEAYNNAIQRCATAHTNLHVVNFHDAFLGHGLHCAAFWSKHYDAKDPHYWYYTNLEDPNERGYDAIRRLFLIEMAKVAKQSQ
jgi:lysophospholipase L1-like esterase